MVVGERIVEEASSTLEREIYVVVYLYVRRYIYIYIQKKRERGKEEGESFTSIVVLAPWRVGTMAEGTRAVRSIVEEACRKCMKGCRGELQ